MLEPDDISTEEIVVHRWAPLVFPKLDLCRCGGAPGEIQNCPYTSEIEGQDEECNCCETCYNNCLYAV